MPTIKEAILNLFAGQEPCTLGEIVTACGDQCEENISELMPLIVITVAEMIGDGTICGYDQEEEDIDDEWDYVWVLSEDPPLTHTELETAHEFANELINACQEPRSEVNTTRIEEES